MNKQEEQLFTALTKDREENAHILDKPSMRGVKKSVVDKYSDQAHFIYELLQNADDAKATSARFILESNRLIFAHNGTRHFSVSDPACEENDSNNGKLGDVNAITSIANSNKTAASIGKFGVGFKAVFQYTSNPEIYDPSFRFRIEHFIVPKLLNCDFPGRRENETLFVFPFDHPERTENVAYEDISNKLRNLSYPLLFLSWLKEIEFQFDGIYGLYGKEIKQTITYGNTVIEQVIVSKNEGEELFDESMWLFSREDDNHNHFSVGFFTDTEGHLKPVNEPAFCFFPTKEVTGLSFIIHAPFLLTDSREGIRAGIEHNDTMITQLAILSAEALERLRDIGNEMSLRIIDDNIINIIPTNPDIFSNPSKKHRISFYPFYQHILTKFQTTALLPTNDGYVSKQNAYWAAVRQLPQLFSNAQLAEIVDNKKACWVFLSLGRDDVLRSNKTLSAYIDSIIFTSVNEDAIICGRIKDSVYNRYYSSMQSVEKIKGIDTRFIERQTFEWLHLLYKWLSETKGRKEMCLDKPFFIDQNGKASAAYDDNDQLILFLPVDGMDGYHYIHSDLLTNQDTEKFIKEIGVKEPSLKDQIYNIILPQYQDGVEIDTDPHFELFFKYFLDCPYDEVDEYIDIIKDCKFLSYYDTIDEVVYRGEASSMYYPTDLLTSYFETKKRTRFIQLDYYLNLVGTDKKEKLDAFLSKLGIKKSITIEDRDINDYEEIGQRSLYPSGGCTCVFSRKEAVMDGCKELIDYVCSNEDQAKSLVLWNNLIQIIKQCRSKGITLDRLLRGQIKYQYYSQKYWFFESSDAFALKNREWLINVDGEFTSAFELNLNTISDIYDTDSDYAIQLLDFLGIKDYQEEIEDDSNLTDEQKEKIAWAEKLKEYGIESEEDLVEFQAYRQKKASRNSSQEKDTDEGYDLEDDYDNEDETEVYEGIPRKRASRKVANDVLNDIAKRTRKQRSDVSIDTANDDMDEDDFMPSRVDYSKKIERAKEKSAAEIDRISYYSELYNKAVELNENSKYSYAWFNTLLELESLNSQEANANSREVSISFGKVDREQGTKRTLILKHPNKHIPQFMEDLADIPMVLHFGNQKKTIAIEVASIKSYTLRVKLKNSADIDDIHLDSITSATIDAKSPAFLLEELKKEFANFEYDNNFNMKDNLCSNIEFVFGPPGTGKTTHLAKNVLIPIMKEAKNNKVLVLTPTNKSADVLVRRIMEVSGTDTSYEKWLVRFGGTSDEQIEQSPVYREKTFDIRTLPSNVTVTTIARFPYDFFMPDNDRLFLNGLYWDYIVIDEASMIPIANIIYPLYKKTPQKFIIAGDPFQIEPITSVDIWKDENIYTLVELDSFENPHTEPYQYKVDLLTTQYRSVPDVGNVFSQFAYDGILNHYRSAESQRSLNIEDEININTLNIIKYPISKYESIYRAKRLNHSSSYQVYSALFTFEYVCFLSRAISRRNPNSLFKIGIIAPYRAQADMIDKLLASEKLPTEIDVQVGTIHGFQGDECDIIFAVFNTPPTISSSKEMFLNKRNIINVSISRARDYLFIVMPNDDTEGIENLRLVNKVESLIHDSGAYCESLSPELEELMFNDANYLENNSFSTSHQSVNVYGLPERRYEIRAEDTAVDVQIHRAASGNPIV